MPALAAEYVAWPTEPCSPAPERRVDDPGRALAALLGLGAPVGAGVPQRREVPLEVHPDHRVPLLLGGVDEHPVADEAGVVDQDVEPAEGVDRLLHHRRGLREVGHVGAVGDRPATGRLDRGDDLVGRRLARALAGRQRDAVVVDHDRRAVRRELERVRAADAATRAGDDRDATLQQASHVSFQGASRKTGGSPPPWHCDPRAGDVRRQVAGQEHGDVADLVGPAIRPSGMVPSIAATRRRRRRSGRRSARCGTARRRSRSRAPSGPTRPPATG